LYHPVPKKTQANSSIKYSYFYNPVLTWKIKKVLFILFKYITCTYNYELYHIFNSKYNRTSRKLLYQVPALMIYGPCNLVNWSATFSMGRDIHSLGESRQQVQNPLEILNKSTQYQRGTRLPVKTLVRLHQVQKIWMWQVVANCHRLLNGLEAFPVFMPCVNVLSSAFGMLHLLGFPTNW